MALTFRGHNMHNTQMKIMSLTFIGHNMKNRAIENNVFSVQRTLNARHCNKK